MGLLALILLRDLHPQSLSKTWEDVEGTTAQLNNFRQSKRNWKASEHMEDISNEGTEFVEELKHGFLIANY